MRKSLLCLLMVCMLMLSACHRAAPGGESGSPGAIERTETSAATSLITYLPSADLTRLIRRNREMVIPEGQMLLQAAIVDLLSEADDGAITPPFGGGASLRSMTLSRNVLLVELTAAQPLEAMDERQLVASVAALVDTVTANSQAEYVQLWINGQALSTRGVLTNPLTQMDTDLERLWILHKHYMEAGEVISTQPNRRILFYTDAGGSFLLAGVDEETTRSGNPVDDLISMMRRVPAGSTGLTSAISGSLTLAQSPQMDRNDRGEQVVSLWFTTPRYENFTGQRLRLLAGAVTMAVHCNFPDVDAVIIYMDNRPITSLPDTGLEAGEILTAETFLPQVADMTTLYFPHQQTGKLAAVERAASQSDASHLSARIDELMRGPLAGEDSALTYAFPVELTAEDLLSVQLQNDCAIVNFSANFEACYPTDAARERQMIYSIVNTLTNEPAINRVQILVEDRRVGALGAIDLTNPLLRNPGIIQK